jgi:hypothetical protein
MEAMDSDKALIRAWDLALENDTEAVEDEFERLLPTLIEAGYAEADEYVWHFTPKGVERANLLSGE